ncbi:PREDICTED: RNA pseudouridine synthase 4, mitochondrial isoform X1 [Populus euphratica]|uniref:RNA pseudouridine synthase 4, mitochondrial isoform X1 n=1 Tax=Populus euphratica TaxID=75702 RepID=A0AAJ6X0G0_POPEU|nr:PREDICTED: RNA pseudouridine synthase 4, mitochondrial isoform X1 [Populus euphratica]
MMMVYPTLLGRVLLQPSRSISSLCATTPYISTVRVLQSQYNTSTKGQNHYENDKRGKWFTLPPYTSTINGSVLGKALSTRIPAKSASETTALKWVLRCCPELPRNLVQKLFRLRQVRRESSVMESCNLGDQGQEHRLKRVAAKDSMDVGDRIFLPISVKALPAEKQDCHCSEEETNFIRGLELYKDDAIIVVNKPPGMPVQGGIGIKRSLDELSASCFSSDYSEPPRLVHRLDRDCSGILVMGRTQTSATVLHAIFREKTLAASNDVSSTDVGDKRRILQRKYWALVIGSPRRQKGLISAPLGKVVVDNGKSDRITVVENSQNLSSQHAVTQYRVIESSHGFTWLELSPLTGRKHQLRVHCAEVLGTPIVGDYKYAWQAHRNWKQLPWSNIEDNSNEKSRSEKILPFALDLDSGGISEKHPRLHLHCKQMVLPDVSKALQDVHLSSDYDFSQLASLKFDAPLPPYMKRSWDILRP